MYAFCLMSDGHLIQNNPWLSEVPCLLNVKKIYIHFKHCIIGLNIPLYSAFIILRLHLLAVAV